MITRKLLIKSISTMESLLRLLQLPPRRVYHQRCYIGILIFLLFTSLYILKPLQQQQHQPPGGGSPFIEVVHDRRRPPESIIREEQVVFRHPLAQNQIRAARTDSIGIIEEEIDNEGGFLKLTAVGGHNRPTPTPATNKRTTTRPNKPRRLKLYAKPLGGIGNQLFQAASCVGIALETDREPVLSPAYEQLFRMFNMTLIIQNPHWRLPHVEEKGFATYSRIAYWRPPGSDAVLIGFFQSWRYFQAYREQLRRQLGLREELLRVAAELHQVACVSTCSGGQVSGKPQISPLLNQQGPRLPEPKSKCGADSCGSLIYVGVHIRHRDVGPNYKVVPASYFQNAMNHFRRKYRNVIFMVVSDDVEWCLRHINGSDVYVIAPMTPERHFAVLARCQHHVVSVGSFGWWAAWLAGGDTVYYDDPVPKSFTHYNEFIKEDYFPENWIPMH